MKSATSRGKLGLHQYISGRFTLHIWNVVHICFLAKMVEQVVSHIEGLIIFISVQSCHFTSRLFLLEQKKVGCKPSKEIMVKLKAILKLEGCILSVFLLLCLFIIILVVFLVVMPQTILITYFGGACGFQFKISLGFYVFLAIVFCPGSIVKLKNKNFSGKIYLLINDYEHKDWRHGSVIHQQLGHYMGPDPRISRLRL